MSGLLLVVFSFPLLVISIAIRLESKGPIVFRQERAGKDGKTFTLYKLRSMYVTDTTEFHAEENVTHAGKFIRRWRIDEIPQFFNVLKGDMSIVGPRPTLPYQIERYTDNQRKRLNVKPGITGWSQINGDKAISWPDRINFDLWYVDNWSLWLDIKIIFHTPFAILRIRNINAEVGPPSDEISHW